MMEPSWTPEGNTDRTIEDNWLFQLRAERFRSRRSGLAHDFYILKLADAVNVVAITPDQNLILVRQFRAGSRTDSLETPGGLLNPGEDPIEAGPRELLEETGYAGDPPRVLGTVWSNPSLLTSKITTIVIENARKVADIALDHGEEVELVIAQASEVPAMIRDGRVDHALAVLGLFLWMDDRSRRNGR